MKDFLIGFRYPLEGFKLITKPKIRLFVIVPFLINSILFSLVIIYGIHQLNNLSNWLSSTLSWADWISWLIWPLFVIISITVIFFCFTLIANLISAPFNGFLAEAVEIHLIGKKSNESSKLNELPGEVIIALKNEIKKLLYFILRAIPLLILFFIPLLNSFAPFIWIVFSSWLISLEYIDFPMSNQGMLFSDIRNKLKSRRYLCIGFGMGTLLMTMIPFINFLAIPVAVASATKLWINELKSSIKIE